MGNEKTVVENLVKRLANEWVRCAEKCRKAEKRGSIVAIALADTRLDSVIEIIDGVMQGSGWHYEETGKEFRCFYDENNNYKFEVCIG